jgi:pyridoxine 5-phosphate synthase
MCPTDHPTSAATPPDLTGHDLMTNKVTLGLNIDHIATLRNARGGTLPDPIAGALMAQNMGVQGITAHLREDRRHIKDADMWALKQQLHARLNMEMAPTDEMVALACQLQPYMCTLVPERRQELTTEGGLDVFGHHARLTQVIQQLTAANIKVSLFILPDPAQIVASQQVGSHYIELHTGPYADAPDDASRYHAWQALFAGAQQAHELGMGVNAGHGLTVANVGPIAALPHMQELNIGHSVMAHALMVGLPTALQALMQAMAKGQPLS